MEYNFIEFFINLFYSFINVASKIWEFLFTTHTLSLSNMLKLSGPGGILIQTIFPSLWEFSIELNIFEVIIGGGFVVFIIMYLVKTFVPTA